MDVSSQLGDAAESEPCILSHILIGVKEMGNECSWVELFIVGETENECFGPAVDVIVDIDSVWVVVVYEVVTLTVDHLVVLGCLLLTQHHVLERGKRLPNFLNVITSLVLSSSVFALVSE